MTRYTWDQPELDFWDLLVLAHGRQGSMKLPPGVRQQSFNQAMSIIGEHEDTLSGPYGYQTTPPTTPTN